MRRVATHVEDREAQEVSPINLNFNKETISRINAATSL
jgi:hypothetical protein